MVPFHNRMGRRFVLVMNGYCGKELDSRAFRRPRQRFPSRVEVEALGTVPKGWGLGGTAGPLRPQRAALARLPSMGRFLPSRLLYPPKFPDLFKSLLQMLLDEGNPRLFAQRSGTWWGLI